MAKRFFRHGELHLVILALLSGRELNGYELMSELSRLFGPAYRPSPGSVYPALKALAGEDLVAIDEDGSRYTTTPPGLRALEERRSALALLEVRTGTEVTTSADGEAEVDHALERFAATVRGAAPAVDAGDLVGAIDEAARQIERLQRHTSEGMAGHG